MAKYKFTFFWKTGHRDVLEGETARDAFLGAGYGGDALRAVECWAHGDNHDWDWDKNTETWIEAKVEANA